MSKSFNEPIQAQSLVELVAERLEAAIMEGELMPGSRLSEYALASTMGVSRGPLREAIRRLEGRKLLQRTPNVGVHVAEMSPKNLIDLLLIRESLEGLVCNLAATRITDEELAQLDACLDQHAEHNAYEAGTRYYQGGKDFDFHVLVAKASGNDILVRMLTSDLYDMLRVYRYRSGAARPRQALEEHRAIVEALRVHDPEKAESTMREHIRNARMLAEAQMADNAKTGLEAETAQTSA